MRRLVAFLGVVILTITGSPAWAAPWTFEFDLRTQAPGTDVFEIEEVYSFGESSKVVLNTISAIDQSLSRTCLRLGTAPCLNDLLGLYLEGRGENNVGKSTIEFRVTLPVCSEAEVKDFCIDNVSLYRSDSSVLGAKYLRSVTGSTTSAIVEHNIPEGGTTSLWSGAAGSGLEDLRLAFFAQATFVANPGPPKGEISYRITSLSIEARPYTLDPTRVITPKFLENVATPGTGIQTPPAKGCEWQDETGCGVRIDYPASVRVGASIRSKYRISEFFNGRLSDPNFTAETVGGVTVLKIDALPVTVPQLAVVHPESAGLREKLGTRPGVNKTLAYYSNAFTAMEVLREFVGDKSSGENTIWRLSSMGNLNSCYEGSGVAGLVVTNATAYGGGAPNFQDGFLDYQVAGMHHLSNGVDVFEGTYDLVIKSDVARCLYGYSKAPISATVTVVGSKGEQKVATTEVTERAGWLKLSAKGFSFSENTVRAKISQPKSSGTPAIGTKPVGGFSMDSFTGANTKLTKAQLASMKLWKIPKAQKVTCIALGASASTKEKTLSIKRASAVCAELKRRDKSLKTTSTFGVGISPSLHGQVIIKLG